MSENKPKIVFLGSGVVGGAAGAWVAEKYDEVFFLDQGEIQAALKEKGIGTYLQGHKSSMVNVKVKVIDDLSQVPDADYVVVAVKNFSLPKVAQLIKDKLGDKPTILSMANGIDNQRVLPNYFSKVIYCVVAFNGIMDEPVVICYHQKGPLVIGTPDNSLQPEMKRLAEAFNLGVETVIVDHLQDAVHSKIIINLVNSLATLVGFRVKEISDPDLFQKILSNLLCEGVKIVEANGYKECKMGGMPPWIKFKASVKLPVFLTRGMFNRNLNKMIMPSMAQDVLLKGMTDTELDSINGYFIELADKAGMKAPYNRVVYELTKRELARDKFEPLDIKEVWKEIQAKM